MYRRRWGDVPMYRSLKESFSSGGRGSGAHTYREQERGGEGRMGHRYTHRHMRRHRVRQTRARAHTHTRTQPPTHNPLHAHTHTYAGTRALTHAHAHTHTHTHTQAHQAHHRWPSHGGTSPVATGRVEAHAVLVFVVLA